MVKKEMVIIADYTDEKPLSLADLCEVCDISSEFIADLVDYAILQPDGESPENWYFDVTHLQRVKKAVRLQRDLEVNMAGIAIVLDLLDELEQLRHRAEFLEQHFNKR